MMVAKKLISIRVLESDWDDFREWADGQGSNATAELNRYIRQCLGRNDSDNDAVQPVSTIRNDSEIQELKAAIAQLQAEKSQFQPPALPDIQGMVKEAISKLPSLTPATIEGIKQDCLSAVSDQVKDAIANLPEPVPQPVRSYDVEIKSLNSRLTKLEDQLLPKPVEVKLPKK